MRIALLPLILNLGYSVVAQDWPEFRGPTGMGLSAATKVPVKWSPTNNISWKSRVPGEGWSSPVISDDRIFLTSATTEDGAVSLRALCFDLQSGAAIWNTEVFRPAPDVTRAKHRKNSLASPTPIIRDGRVYVHFGHMGTGALDLDGKVLWRNNQINYSSVHGAGGSPALAGNLLIFNCDAANDPFITALDAETGKMQWKTSRNTHARSKFSFSTPLLIETQGEKQIISPGSGFVGGYDPASGKELWRIRYGEGYSVIGRPVFAHSLLYVSSSFDQPVVYAIQPGGRGDLSDRNVAWTQRRGAPNTPSMLAVDNELYFVSDSGIATCADARTGKTHWSERLGGNFSASPVAAEGRVYFQNESGTAFVGAAKTQYELLSRNDLGERTLASPAPVDGGMIIRSENHLWRIGHSQ